MIMPLRWGQRCACSLFKSDRCSHALHRDAVKKSMEVNGNYIHILEVMLDSHSPIVITVNLEKYGVLVWFRSCLNHYARLG